jgi:capsular polysaccharide biosynthesis protein
VVDPDQADKVVSIEMEWAKLGRAHSLAKAHQADLENKLYRAEMLANTVEAGYGSNIVVLDPAYKPSGPSNAPNRTVVMIGLFASVAMGVVFSAAWGLFLDDRLFSPGEIESSVMVPVLGIVPRDDRKKGKKGQGGAKPGSGRQAGLSRA